MTSYDPIYSAWMITEAREHRAAAIGPHPSHLDSAQKRAAEIDRLGGINGMIDLQAALADQLKAAGQEIVDHEVERSRARDIIGELQVERNALLVEAEELRGVMGRLKTRICHLKHVGPCSVCGDRAQDLRDLLDP